jgi:hypothetical protein
MSITSPVTTIRASDTRGTRADRDEAGRLVMLPVGPGIERGPARASASNPASNPIMGRDSLGRPTEDAPPGTATGLFRQATQ